MSYKVQKPCRVCGKMYTPCSDCENDKISFHWRSVACSIECATEYFKRIETSRKQKDIKSSKHNTLSNIIKEDVANSNNAGHATYIKENKRSKNKGSEQIG